MINKISNTGNINSFKYPKTIAFKGNTTQGGKILDSFLTSKPVKKAFEWASLYPTAFMVGVLATVGLILRPATIMVIPGSNKEDKSYASIKSMVSTTINTTAKLALFIPFGMYMKHLGKKATETPLKGKFPELGSNEFKSFNYLLSGVLGLTANICSAALLAELVAKVMNKVMPPKQDSSNSQKVRMA